MKAVLSISATRKRKVWPKDEFTLLCRAAPTLFKEAGSEVVRGFYYTGEHKEPVSKSVRSPKETVYDFWIDRSNVQATQRIVDAVKAVGAELKLKVLLSQSERGSEPGICFNYNRKYSLLFISFRHP